jgi:hypothetical protein
VASVALVPLTIGLIVASGACMALIRTFGRVLVLIGLLVTMAGVGSASVLTVYFSGLKASGQSHAMTLSLLVVIGIITLCLAVWPLLPRKAAVLEH